MGLLKILFLIDSLGTGGAERYLAEKLPHLAQFGIEPLIVALRARSEGVQREIQEQGFDVRVLEARGPVGRIRELRTLLRTERPDLLETTLFHADVTGRLAAIGTGVRVISRLVNTDYDGVRLGDPRVGRLRLVVARIIDGWTARHLTDQIYANSEAVRASAARDLRIAPDAVRVVPECRDGVRLGRPGAERRRRARLALGLDDEDEVLVNVGRQDYQKGQDRLLEAVALLAPSHPRLVLLVAGRPGDRTADLEALRTRLGLEDRVHFLGHRTDVPEVLAASDVFVFPSLYEGLPGAVIEAMAMGLPIVASDIAPVRETVDTGTHVFLVDRSPAAFAGAVERLLTDRAVAHAFGERNRARFEDHFSLERGITAAASLYRHVARRP